MLNIVIPMAGRGSRFKEKGFDLPKPLIPVGTEAMIQKVIGNLRPRQDHRFLFICLREHLESHGLGASLAKWAPGCIVLPLDTVTEGAACTVLLAERFIRNTNPLLIANCDQWIDADINAYLADALESEVDGSILTMHAADPKWSYVRLDDQGRVTELVEKQVVSPEATVGVYWFRRGADFVAAAREMIEADRRVKGEFYVAPVYNEMLRKGARLGIYNIGAEGRGMFGLGIPEDLDKFLKLHG